MAIPNHVVVVGAHLDSVEAGPGINDDGSGTAAAADDGAAARAPGHPLKQKIRFGWWGAEEEGLVGSNYYAAEPLAARGRQDRRDARLRHALLAQLRAAAV